MHKTPKPQKQDIMRNKGENTNENKIYKEKPQPSLAK